MPEKYTVADRKRDGRKGGLAPHHTRTHWTKGKRRNDPGDDWAVTKKRLCNELSGSPIRGLLSIAQCARHSGVSSRTIRKYMDGQLLPTRQTATKIVAWLERMRRGK